MNSFSTTAETASTGTVATGGVSINSLDNELLDDSWTNKPANRYGSQVGTSSGRNSSGGVFLDRSSGSGTTMTANSKPGSNQGFGNFETKGWSAGDENVNNLSGSKCPASTSGKSEASEVTSNSRQSMWPKIPAVVCAIPIYINLSPLRAQLTVVRD